MNSKRPVNLDLATIKLPLPAYTSIVHRITGVILFIGLAFLFSAFDSSLESEASFNAVKETLQESAFAKFVLWGLLSALAYHLVAGIKHLIMDLGIGETLEGGLQGAKLTLAISAFLILLAGVWVW
ncbi:succinate dehydrogenase, cytochrome b556 subunit [Oceanospirillum beijerinckii]|uniref:succinate dehydrogenase, cytochrome b556 subunit n=1 Tax=Oceanospirillum beijerinckii TaxID=64976 RepID=UPI0004078BD9|nr:succinate dehydrogenase, cytochrome b556 subunit [Oceanospirillum beijerinckii]MAC47756.1 succinate dehydrogenase, cytochrome b556 subunit [Oceanospirillum sp.]